MTLGEFSVWETDSQPLSRTDYTWLGPTPDSVNFRVRRKSACQLIGTVMSGA